MSLLKQAKDIDPRAVEQIKINLAKQVSISLNKLVQIFQKNNKESDDKNLALLQETVNGLIVYINAELAKLQTIIITPPGKV